MSKVALITGIRGQDGAYLSRFLLEKGYRVYGADRRSSEGDNWRLKELGVEKDVEVVYMDLLELTNMIRIMEQIKPDELYNLAAQSFVGASFEQPILTSEVDAMGVLRLLEAIRTVKPDTRFYQASTSELYGKVQRIPQIEDTPFYPRSPYGVAKLFAHWMTVNYRESYGMFACSGILFNHESPLRGLEFVTRKITNSVARIRRGLQDRVVLGNLEAKRDWGYAAEYVEGMWLMLQQGEPDDYVLATGEAHSVREFIEAAFDAAGFHIEWEGVGENTVGKDRDTGRVLVEVSREFYRPAEVDILVGNPEKAYRRLGWKPRTGFNELVAMMVEADMRRVERSYEELPCA